jgi:uncharacterized protein YdeI (YjbR/CyaY-like superfamily)
MPITQSVDTYLLRGCGRCELFDTPACKVHRWQPELAMLRGLMQETRLTEESKWGVPCYTWQGKNVTLLGALKESVSLSFMNGALLNDPEGLLQKAGENSHVDRLLRFTKVSEIEALAPSIFDFVEQAIAYTEAGLKPPPPAQAAPWPEELHHVFAEDEALHQAFLTLTPGRQRGYLLHFNQAKQSTTRRSRILACRTLILKGKGLNDR